MTSGDTSPAMMRRVPDHQDGDPPRQSRVMLAVRFLVEIVALSAVGFAGWRIGEGSVPGAVLGALFVVIAATFWSIFSVRNDPSRNPDPVIAVRGWVRLVIEFAVFGLAAWSLWAFVSRAASESFLTVVGIISLVGWDRLWWMLRHR